MVLPPVDHLSDGCSQYRLSWRRRAFLHLFDAEESNLNFLSRNEASNLNFLSSNESGTVDNEGLIGRAREGGGGGGGVL